MYRLAISLLLLMLSLTNVKAQEPEYMFEIGAGAGISWAYGDINKTKAFYSPAFAGELLFRYNLNPRWAFASSIANYGVK